MTNEQKPREFLEYPMVIDWLQWSDEFEEVLGKPDMPQVTLTLISEMKAKIAELQKENQLLITALKTCELEIPKGFDGSGDNLFKAVRELITNTLNYCEQNKGK